MLREVVGDDAPFIYATWLRGLYHGNDLYQEIDRDVFFAHYHKILELLLSRSFIRIACLKSDPEVILGYVVYSGPRLHWIFVKKAWRRLGIAKALLPEGITTFTHPTKVGLKLGKGKGLSFNPFL